MKLHFFKQCETNLKIISLKVLSLIVIKLHFSKQCETYNSHLLYKNFPSNVNHQIHYYLFKHKLFHPTHT